MDSTSSRIFFALLPGPDIREKLTLVSDDVDCPDGRRVIADNYHLTLLFLGAVGGSEQDQLCRDCDSIHAASFTLRIDHSGWWRRPKVLWIGPAEVPDSLVSLHDHLCALAQSRRLLDDTPSFRPHITLLRKIREPPVLPVFPPFHWTVDSFCLMESLSAPDGVRYRVVAKWPLHPPQAAPYDAGGPAPP